MTCVIPARIGSKRLARKNIALFRGKPILAYSIEQALASRLFDRVYVATESEEIADIARKWGAVVPFLTPVELSGDANGSLEPCMFLLGELEKQGERYENMFCAQPTSVLRKAHHFLEAYRLFKDSELEFCASVNAVDPHDFHWVVEEEQIGRGKLFFGKKWLKDRSELPPFYSLNGAIKLGNVEALRRDGHFFNAAFAVYKMTRRESFFLYTQDDLNFLDTIFDAK